MQLHMTYGNPYYELCYVHYFLFSYLTGASLVTDYLPFPSFFPYGN